MRTIGSRYEQKAAAYLQKQGWKVLEWNYRCPLGEIDLIARKENILAFIEVKYRQSGLFGTPFSAVDARKQRKIYQTARWYLSEKQVSPRQICRFDVIGFSGEKLEHLEDAFGGM